MAPTNALNLNRFHQLVIDPLETFIFCHDGGECMCDHVSHGTVANTQGTVCLDVQVVAGAGFSLTFSPDGTAEMHMKSGLPDLEDKPGTWQEMVQRTISIFGVEGRMYAPEIPAPGPAGTETRKQTVLDGLKRFEAERA